MKHRLIALGLLASAVGLAQAQSTRQLYLVKGKKVVATFPASDVDFITFDGTQQFYLPITLKQGEGTTIVMYNASDDWDKDPAERKFDQLAGQPVKFVWYSDYGFDGTLKITSASGDDVPYEYVTDDEDFGSCWLCIMPAEPITIETVGTEKTTFAGRAFVGDYKGFPISVGANGVLQSAAPTLNLNLAANSSFHATVSGEKTFGGCYTFNDATNRFSYDDAYSADVWGRRTYGVSGKWFEGGDALVVVNDLNNDKPDYNRYYFASTADCSYTAAASDSYGSRYLLELLEGSARRWYYYDRLSNSIEPVSLSFSKGASVADAADALVSNAAGETLFRYTRASETAQPTFQLKGKEAGTFLPESGTGDALVLDGFGNATYGSAKGTYTYENGVVKMKPTTGSEMTFLVDLTTMKYSTSAAAEWDGAENFATPVNGRYDSNAMSMGMFALQFNHNYAGKEAKGSVKVQVTLTSDMYETKEIIASTASYTYDATAKQITVSGVLAGTADGRNSERISIVFDVNDAKTQLTCNEDKLLRAVSGGDTRYINLKGLTLQAR